MTHGRGKVEMLSGLESAGSSEGAARLAPVNGTQSAADTKTECRWLCIHTVQMHIVYIECSQQIAI